MKKSLFYSALTCLIIVSGQLKVFSQGTYFMCSTSTVSDTSGLLYDSGGPNGYYQMNENCTLLIAPVSAAVIILRFQEFATEAHYDIFNVYDGQTTADPLLLSTSGYVIPAPVIATSGYMLIVWHSDISITDSGFACTWSTVNCPCGIVSGTTYNDMNGNCVADTGEELRDIPVLLDDGAQIALWRNTDSLGHYSFYVPVSSIYNVHVDFNTGHSARFAPTCPSSGVIAVNTVPSPGNDFGMVCRPGYDLTGNITGWRFRPGFVASVCVTVYNQRCNTPSGQIELIFDSDLTPLPDTSGIGYTISGNSVFYPINGPASMWTFCIHVLVSLNAQIGDSVCVNMVIDPLIGDSIPLDNTGTFCFPVRASFDPNDKYVRPLGVGTPGFILPNTPLTYTVRFQNTGNADAVNVHILDELNPNLDPATIEIVAASHAMHWSLLPQNFLQFNFDNINLPDSNSNEFASHGYVTYRVHPFSNLAQLAQITNSASIYFDFNSPVYTNTTLNTIDQFLSYGTLANQNSLMNIYPNPADRKCYLNFKDNHLRRISVSDMTGKEVFNCSATSSYILNTEKYADGFYTIRFTDDRGQIDFCKLIILH